MPAVPCGPPRCGRPCPAPAARRDRTRHRAPPARAPERGTTRRTTSGRPEGRRQRGTAPVVRPRALLVRGARAGSTRRPGRRAGSGRQAAQTTLGTRCRSGIRRGRCSSRSTTSTPPCRSAPRRDHSARSGAGRAARATANVARDRTASATRRPVRRIPSRTATDTGCRVRARTRCVRGSGRGTPRPRPRPRGASARRRARGVPSAGDRTSRGTTT